MKKFEFTALTAADSKLIPKDVPQVDYWDTKVSGFGMRVTQSGTRTWQVVGSVKVDGKWKPYRVRIGRANEMKLKDARDAASEVVKRAKAGEDLRKRAEAQRKEYERSVTLLAQIEAEEAENKKKESTFGKVRDKYLTARDSKLRASTMAGYRRMLASSYFSQWNDRPVEEITRREVHDALLEVAKDISDNAAHQHFTALRAMMKWASKNFIIEPASAPTNDLHTPPKAPARKRCLSEIELELVWKVLNLDQERTFWKIKKLLILTGQRLNEIGELRWSEILDLDGQNPMIQLPPERTKNKLPHLVPLCATAVDVLKSVERIKDCDLIFSTTGKTAVSGYSKAKRHLDRDIKKLIEEMVAKAEQASDTKSINELKTAFSAPWVVHDFRRTAVTSMNEMGIDPHVVEAIVNHVSGQAKAGVAGVYNKAQYLKERRAALKQWEQHLISIVKN
jgi:integrase